jgi:hypothetical protein
LALDSSWPITSTILIAAFEKKWLAVVCTVLSLITKRKTNAISELVDETVMLAVLKGEHSESITYFLRFLRQHNIPVPITAKIINLAAGLRTDVFTLIIQRFLEQSSHSDLRALITSKTTSRMAIGLAGHANFGYLSGLLDRAYLLSLFNEESLLRATAWDAMLDLVFSAITPLHSKEYYTNIGKLHEAVYLINLIAIKRLMDGGTNPNIPNSSGRPPLVEASQYSDFGVVKLLLKYDTVDLNGRDKDGRTSLHLAAVGDSNLVAKELLEKGADKTLVDKDGKTAEVVARESGNYALEVMIRNWGTEDKPGEGIGDEEVVTPGREVKMFLRSSKTF